MNMTDDAFVRRVQQSLADRGFDVGPVDGIAGQRTQLALAAALGPVPVLPPEQPATNRQFDARSRRNLEGVHPDLVRVMERAIDLAPMPFVVIEGLRTVARQKELVASGASRTMRSRHLTGHAVDIVPTRPDGSIAFDWPLYHKLAPAVKGAAIAVGVPLEWGGDWTSFKDGPHFQLPWADYP